MAEFEPVKTVEDLRTLDPVEVVEGYIDGFRNEPEPGNNRTRSYWHGWRNGMADGEHCEIDAAQRQLAYEIIAEQRCMERDHG